MEEEKSNNNATPSVSRRGFLTWLGGFGTGAFASYIANQIPPVKNFINKLSHPKTALSTIIAPRKSVRFYQGTEHYIVQGLHSDNAIAGKALLEAIMGHVNLKPDIDLALFELDEVSDWVLIGAPSSSRVAAQLLGYKPSNLTISPESPKGLRYIYEYEDTLVNIKRFMASGQLQAIAKRASIRDLKTGNVYRPDEGGWLDEDYMLITRIPSTKFSGSRTIIGGTHGVGTKGIDLLLHYDHFSRDQKMKLQEGIGKGFQIFAKIEAKTEGSNTKPSNAQILDIQVL